MSKGTRGTEEGKLPQDSLATPSLGTEKDARTVLELGGVCKDFEEVRALADVALTLVPGEVHGLVGHNGSGKSTLVKILAGFHQPEPGWSASVASARLALGDADSARDAGLRFVHQDLGLVGTLDAVDNIWLGAAYPTRRLRRIDRALARVQARDILIELGYDLDLDRPVDQLDAVERTGVALARALLDVASGRVKVVVLDEPTAALPSKSVQRLFDAIGRIRARGVAVLYITHHLDELFAISDRLTVLRNGRAVASVPTDTLDHDGLVELMLGRRVQFGINPTRAVACGCVALDVEHLIARGIDDLTFAAHRGEILGVAGVAGSGREHLAAALYGAVGRGGQVRILGAELAPRRPDRAIAAGIGLVPAQRARNALLPEMSLRENLTIAQMTGPLGGVRLSRSAERAETRDWLSRLAVHPAEPELCVSKLSGGNQQRLILGRCLRLDPAVLVLDEPTEGVDVGAIEVIHDMLRTAAHRDGKAVIVCSSNTEELVALCDRVMVLGRGRPPRTLSGPDINRDAIDALALADTEANQCPA